LPFIYRTRFHQKGIPLPNLEGNRPTAGGLPHMLFVGYRQGRDLADKATRRRIRRLGRKNLLSHLNYRSNNSFHSSIKVNIQIRTIEAVAAVGAVDLAVPFDHLTAAAIAQVDLFGRRRLLILFWRGKFSSAFQFSLLPF
jgi:hypothetical protein